MLIYYFYTSENKGINMKKIFSLATIAIAVFTLSACCGPWGHGGHGGQGGGKGGMPMQQGHGGR